MAVYLFDVESSDQYQVNEPLCKIGSATSNDIVVAAEHVAPNHVRIERKGIDFYVSLVGGVPTKRKFLLFFDIPNATHNRSPLEYKQVKLSNGDKLQIGSRLFEFRVV